MILRAVDRIIMALTGTHPRALTNLHLHVRN